MNQVTKNVEELIGKYGRYIDTDTKLVLLYLREFESLRFDSRYIAVEDFINTDVNLIQDIVNAKHILELLEEDE